MHVVRLGLLSLIPFCMLLACGDDGGASGGGASDSTGPGSTSGSGGGATDGGSSNGSASSAGTGSGDDGTTSGSHGTSGTNTDVPGPAPTVDPDATPETRSLFESLRDLASTQLLVGMENATREGEFQLTKPIDGYNSDIREVCGQGPMIHGFDVAAVVGDWWPGNPDQQDLMDQFQAEYIDHMQKIYERGGVITMAWHALNPIDGSDAWNGPHELWQLVEPSRCAALEADVGSLPGCGAAFDTFAGRVAILADFFDRLVTDEGTAIPVILRPFHENSGGWFWWGADGVDPDVYKRSLYEVWAWMVGYFADTRDIHQILWSISPNGGAITENSYLALVPDMALVDVLGYDIYPDDMTDHVDEIAVTVALAEQDGKVPAVTETGPGLAGDPGAWEDDVWSRRVVGPVLDHADATRVAYLMLWFNRPGGSHWGPYASHPSAPDFNALCTSDAITMEGEIDLYH